MGPEGIEPSRINALRPDAENCDGSEMGDAVISEKTVDNEMKRIKVLQEGIRIMHDKAVFRIIRLVEIRAPMANLIKEEMLAAGGDAAVHWQAIACKIQKTDVILFGTLAQYKRFIEKMKIQPFESKEIAGRVQKLLKLNL